MTSLTTLKPKLEQNIARLDQMKFSIELKVYHPDLPEVFSRDAEKLKRLVEEQINFNKDLLKAFYA